MWQIVCVTLLLIWDMCLAQEGTFAQPGAYQQQGALPGGHPGGQPQRPSPYLAPPVGFLHNQALDGSYNFAYQTKDGQTRAETTGKDGAVRGSYVYTSPEGQQVQVSYTADQNGFHAESDAIPRAAGPSPAQVAPQPQYQPPPPQPQYQPQYSAPAQQQYQPQPQYAAPQPQAQYSPQYAAAPQYAPQQRQPEYPSTRTLGNTPIANYAYGDSKVLTGLQDLFKG